MPQPRRSDRQRGPWRVLCDNESFLKASNAAHMKVNVVLSKIPPRSPDLNPVEKFWGWMRKQLRAMDLDDLVRKRQPVTKAQLKARVRRLMRSAKAKRVAKNFVKGLRNVCFEVLEKGGGATRG